MDSVTLKSVQFVVDQEGRPSAVQISMQEWEALVDWIEELEDRALVQSMAETLRQGPKAAGALRWEDIRDEWDRVEAE